MRIQTLLASTRFGAILICALLLWTASLGSVGSAWAQPGDILQILAPTGDGSNAVDGAYAIAVDGYGDVFVAAADGNDVFKVSPGRTVTRVMDGTGDGVSTLERPLDVAVDGRGNAYVAGRSSHNVFRVSRDGMVTEILDELGGDGFGGLAFAAPFAVASDHMGNVYVTGEFSHNAFRIAPSGAVTQIIDATGDGLGNGLGFPTGIAVDTAGNVFVAGHGSDNVFRIAPDGTVSLLVDFGDPNRNPGHLAVDSSGNLFVVVEGDPTGSGLPEVQVLKIAPDGTVSEVWDSGAGLGEDGRVSIATDGAGNLYVPSARANRVFRVASDGTVLQWVDASGDGSNGLDRPLGVAADAAGNVFVSGVVSNNALQVFCPDDDGDGLCNRWETLGVDLDLDGIRDLDLPNIAGPGVGTDPNHKDLFVEFDWTTGQEPTQAAIHSMKTAFAMAPVDAGGTMNPDGLPGIKLWVDTGTLVDPNGFEDPTSTLGSCNDGVDNGGDGFADANDSDCRVADDLTREDGVGSCSDGLDNDGDGALDTADPECQSRGNEFGAEAGSCADGIDNDLDGVMDGADSDCLGGGNALWDPAGNELGGVPDGTCSDGLDNQSDGLIDGLDPNCLFVDTGQFRGVDFTFYDFKHGTESLIPSEDGGGPGTCRDGVDNGGGDEDGNGTIDRDGRDPECRPTCFNGTDDDMDGAADAADTNCQTGGNFDRLTRRLVFRYAISAGPTGGGGQGERLGNDFIEKNHDGGTVMHELGHNLGLQHGGGDGVNRKPNYISVMDYDEQFCIFGRNATVINCVTQRRLVDYSPARFGGNEGMAAGANACFDGRDNDGNGLIDAEDPQCLLGISRAAAPLGDLVETSLDESIALDPTDTGHSFVFTDGNDQRRLWNADADIDGDGASDGIDWNASGPPAPFTDSMQQVDVNRDGICVCSGPDLVGDTMTPAVDDVPLATGPRNCRPSIRTGLDRTCDTAAAASDVQTRQVGFEEPDPLEGFDDWSNITMNLRLSADKPDDGLDLVEEPELTLDEMVDQLVELLGTDLAVMKSAVPDPVEVGTGLVYRLTVTNNGPNVASQVQVVDVLPARVLYQSDTHDCDEVGGVVTCDLGEMAVGGSAEIEITVGTGAVCSAGIPATITNNVSVADVAELSVFPGIDPDPTNDIASSTMLPVDTTPPELTLAVSPEALWPPNHKFVDIVASLETSDLCDPEPTIRLVSITSNEPQTGPGKGKGKAGGDIRGAEFGTDDREFQLRAERLGSGDGRVYTIVYEAIDGSGNRTTREASVTVGHDRR